MEGKTERGEDMDDRELLKLLTRRDERGADELLRSGSFTVAEVAAALGFFDTAHFCRTYKKLRGAPPGGALPHSSQ